MKNILPTDTLDGLIEIQSGLALKDVPLQNLISENLQMRIMGFSVRH